MTLGHVALISTGLTVGGAETVVINLADELVRRGLRVSIIVITGDPELRPVEASVEVYCLHMMKTPWGVLRGFLDLCKALRHIKPDVVHAHMFHANLLARLVRMVVPLPRLVCTAHSTNEGGLLHMLAYRLTHSLADVTTNVSKEAVAKFEALGAAPRGSMIPVYNSIDTEKFKPDLSSRELVRKNLDITDETIVLLAVGRLVKAKDYPNLINAFSMAKNSLQNIHLWIVGSGVLLKDIESMIKQQDLIDHIDLLGLRRDTAQLMNAADIFIQGSAWEGFGLSIAEAMACGLPVIATDAGGVSEVMGKHGILVPIKNPHKLALKIVEEISSGEFRSKSNKLKARNHITQRFDKNVITKEWLSIYFPNNS